MWASTTFPRRCMNTYASPYHQLVAHVSLWSCERSFNLLGAVRLRFNSISHPAAAMHSAYQSDKRLIIGSRRGTLRVDKHITGGENSTVGNL